MDHDRRFLYKLFEKCKSLYRESHPNSSIDLDRLDLTGKVRCEPRPFTRGWISDIYRGQLEGVDSPVVAVRIIRLPALPAHFPDDNNIYQKNIFHTFSEFLSWFGLNHANLVPMLGLTLAEGDVGLIAPWYEHGNLTEYLRDNGDASKPDLILDVAEGMQYLHTRSSPLIIGKFCAMDVLVDQNGIARLNFGLSRQIEDILREPSSPWLEARYLPWTAPELLELEDSPPWLPSDIYSLGGVLLEVCCPGKTPYHYMHLSDLVNAKARGKPPDLSYYPEMVHEDTLWQLLCSCWEFDPSDRPSIAEVVRYLYQHFRLKPRVDATVGKRPPKGGLDEVLSSPLTPAGLSSGSPVYPDDVTGYSEEDRVGRIDMLYEQCKSLHQKSYPTSPIDFDQLNLSDRVECGPRPYGRGHFANVYRGHLADGTVVAVKMLQLLEYRPDNDKAYEWTLMRFFREIHCWSRLNHINVARMLGFTVTNGNIGLISPWCEHGNLVQYLNRNPGASKSDLMLDVAEGTNYLHTGPVPLIHGDLKAVNVLVNHNGIARLTDFGISKQIDDMNRTTGFTTGGEALGTALWMGPELFEGSPLSRPSDIYSLAGVFLEIYCAGKTPYYYMKSAQALVAKIQGLTPERQHYPEMTGNDALWQLLLACWEKNPTERPIITTVLQELYRQCSLSPRVDESIATRPSASSSSDDRSLSTGDEQAMQGVEAPTQLENSSAASSRRRRTSEDFPRRVKARFGEMSPP